MISAATVDYLAKNSNGNRAIDNYVVISKYNDDTPSRDLLKSFANHVSDAARSMKATHQIMIAVASYLVHCDIHTNRQHIIESLIIGAKANALDQPLLHASFEMVYEVQKALQKLLS